MSDRPAALQRGPIKTADVHPHAAATDASAVVKALSYVNRKAAVLITIGFGSMWAFWVLVGWQLGWIAWQTSGWHVVIHDPYPFTFCLFLSNLIQLWALPALMVGQNVLARHADARAEADHEILSALDTVNRQQLTILERLDRTPRT